MVMCSECEQRFADKTNDMKCYCGCHERVPNVIRKDVTNG